MRRAFTILGAVLAALVCALTGAYVLWQFHTNWGLIGGILLELLAVAIALPVPLHAGAVSLKENVVLVLPVLVDALKGGSRRTDPPPDSPAKKEGP